MKNKSFLVHLENGLKNFFAHEPPDEPTDEGPSSVLNKDKRYNTLCPPFTNENDKI